MKKSKKIFLRLLPVVLLLVVITFNTAIYGIDVKEPTAGKASSNVTTVTGRVWGTVAALVQVAAVAAVIIAGLRYMFSSADTKADIKKEIVPLVAGAILVFLAVPVISFVVNVSKDILDTK